MCDRYFWGNGGSWIEVKIPRISGQGCKIDWFQWSCWAAYSVLFAGKMLGERLGNRIRSWWRRWFRRCWRWRKGMGRRRRGSRQDSENFSFNLTIEFRRKKHVTIHFPIILFVAFSIQTYFVYCIKPYNNMWHSESLYMFQFSIFSPKLTETQGKKHFLSVSFILVVFGAFGFIRIAWNLDDKQKQIKLLTCW